MHAVVTTPAGLVGPIRSYPPPASAFHENGRVGSCIMVFEACSTFIHITACMLAKPPKAALYIRGFSSFVTSTTAPIATGWSDPVPGWDSPPTEDQRLFTAHRSRPLMAFGTAKIPIMDGKRHLQDRLLETSRSSMGLN